MSDNKNKNTQVKSELKKVAGGGQVLFQKADANLPPSPKSSSNPSSQSFAPTGQKKTGAQASDLT